MSENKETGQHNNRSVNSSSENRLPDCIGGTPGS